MSKSLPLQQFSQSAERIEGEVLELLQTFREFLEADEESHDDVLAEAESYLYDALDCLVDFRENCAQAMTTENA